MSSASVEGLAGGDAEIDNVPSYEVEIRRARSMAKCPSASSLEAGQYKGEISEESVICHSKPASLCSTGSSDGGSSRRIENLLDLDPVNCEKFIMPISHTLNELYLERGGCVSPSLLNKKPKRTEIHPSKHYNNANSHIDTDYGRIMTAPLLTTDHFSSAIENIKEASSGVKEPVILKGVFREVIVIWWHQMVTTSYLEQ